MFKMEITSQFKEAKHIEWTTPIPVHVPIKSSKFTLRNCECILTFSLVSATSYFGNYKLCVLNIFSERKITFPINVTVFILPNNNIPAELSRVDLTGTELWRCSKSRVQKYLINSVVTLGITFHFSKTDSDDCLDALSKDFGLLLLDETFSDAKIKCEDIVWNIHKNIISVRSKTFSQLILNDTKGELEIQDLDKSTVEVFLNYLYTGKLRSLTIESAKQLYAASDKYAAVHLKENCAAFLMENLEPKDACEILALANMHSDIDFKKYVIDYISEQKIPLMDDIWNDFCNKYPELANEVLNHIYKLKNLP